MMVNGALIGPVTTPDLHVMTYNIRRRSPRHRPWDADRAAARSSLVRRLLTTEQPTLLGVQEALADQVDFVADALGTDYLWVGNGRNPSGGDERCAVFYDARRLELTDWTQWALSATPHEPGSRSWGNLAHRVVVSADFTDLGTRARLRAFNTHFDHLSSRSRIESAKFVMHLVQAARAAEPDAAIVMTGDFNAGVGSAAYRWLTAEGALRDAWDVAAERLTPQWATYSNFRHRRRRPGGKRIDFIMVGHGVDVVRTGINAARFEGRAASDHEPVQSVLRYGDALAGAPDPTGVVP